MSETNELIEQQKQLIEALATDRDALMSPQWDRIKQIITMRRDLLREKDESSDIAGAESLIRKGRIRECKMLLDMMDTVQEGITQTADYLRGLVEFNRESDAAEEAAQERDFSCQKKMGVI